MQKSRYSKTEARIVYYSALLVRTGNASQALYYAQRAAKSSPNSADAYTMLGYAQFTEQ